MAGEDFVREMYDASYLRLVIQIYALSGDLADAEDAVQEAFVTALGRGRAFARLDNHEAWLRTVALNHVRNRWRHLEVVRRLRTKVPGPTAEGEVGPEHVALVEALGKLDPPHRTVVVLHYLADRSVRDIALELGIAGAVHRIEVEVARRPPQRPVRRRRADPHRAAVRHKHA